MKSARYEGQEREAILLDVFQRRIRLEGRLTTRTAIHIGAGGSGDFLATDAPVVKDAMGIPFIPGSSLKGVLRSGVESMFRGSGKESFWSCDFMLGKPCVDHRLDKKTREEVGEKSAGGEASREVARKIWRQSCPVCRLFGSSAMASRVRFPDLLLEGDAPMLEIRNGVGIERDKELAADGVLYDFEAVPPGTSFRLLVLLDNPTDEEIGLLLYLFDELDSGHLALGGKVSRGLGQVAIEWTKIEEIDLRKENPFASMLSRKDLLVEAAAELKKEEETAFDGFVPRTGDREKWRALVEAILEQPGLETQPKLDRTYLSKKSKEIGLTRKNLNEVLQLGLKGKQFKKPWPGALKKLVETGFLAMEGSDFVVVPVGGGAGGAVEGGAGGGSASTGQVTAERTPELQQLIDRYVGAMAKAWERARKEQD